MNYEEGVPYPSKAAGPIDGWSERIYQALKGWQIAQEGNWSRWDPGYVLLTVTRVRGRAIDPIFVYTANEELTVAFADWEIHNPDRNCSFDGEPEQVARNTMEYVEEWLRGDFRTGVFFKDDGGWCGTTELESGDVIPQLQAAARRLFVTEIRPVRVEVRTPYVEEWEQMPVPFKWLRPAP